MQISVAARPDEFRRWLAAFADKQDRLLQMVEKMAHTLNDAIDLIRNQDTAIDGLMAMIGSLRIQVGQALAGAVISPQQQANLEAVFAEAESRKGDIEKALDTNVIPPQPPLVLPAEELAKVQAKVVAALSGIVIPAPVQAEINAAFAGAVTDGVAPVVEPAPPVPSV